MQLNALSTELTAPGSSTTRRENHFNRKPTEPRKGHFLSDIYQKRNSNKEIRTEIKTKNISFYRLIISFQRYNKSLKRYKIEWKLKQEKQNGN